MTTDKPKTTIKPGDTVQIQIRSDGYSQRLYAVERVERKGTTDYVLVDLSSPQITGIAADKVRLVKAAESPVEHVAKNATETAPDAVQATTVNEGTANAIGGTVESQNAVLLKQLEGMATVFSDFVDFVITEQSALVGEVSFYLDLTWTLTERLGKARKTAKDWRTVAENTVKEAAKAETERDGLRDRVKALEEELRQAQAERDLFEARLSDANNLKVA